MAPSSLKKMSGVPDRKEGNYASLETKSWGRFINHDLGLTLLPGSQIQRKDEKRSGTTAESSLKNGRSRNVGRLDQWKSSESEIQSKHPAHEAAFLNEAESPSNSPDPRPGLAELSNVTTREPLFSKDFSAANSTGAVYHNVNSVAASPYDEQKSRPGEIRKANSCQHDDDSSSRAAKRRRLGSRISNEMGDSQVSKEREAAFESHYNRFHVQHDQNLPEIKIVHSEKRYPSFATVRVPFGGTEGGLGSSKLRFRRQTTHRPDTVPARSHQSINLGSEDQALLGEFHQPLKVSKSVSTQHWEHSGLFPDTTADIRTRVLKPRKEVNRSWTCHFPAKAKTLRRANLPAPSFLAAPFTPSKDHEHPHPINALLTPMNLHANTQFSSSHPSPSLPNNLSLSKSFNYPSELCALEDTFDTAHPGNQRQSVRKRSASLPNLPSTCSPMNMAPSNSFGPASMPTPPREQPSSLSKFSNAPIHQSLVDPPRGHVDPFFHADNSSGQNWQSSSNLQYQDETSLSDRQIMDFTPGIHDRQALTQDHQHMTGPFMFKDGAMTAGRPQYSRRRLDVKSNYSHEEVKSLAFGLVRQAQTLQAENTSLQSSNTAMKKGFESLQQEKADMIQQIQRYERTVAQKNQQIKVMQQQGSSLQHQYKRMWDEHHRLLAKIRKEDGTGNPSAIAQKIRYNHSPNTAGAASQGGQPNAKASPVYCANGAQLPISSHGFEQTPTGFQGHVQPVSIPGSSEAIVTNASSRSLGHLGYAAANHNNANLSQTVTIPAYPKTEIAKARNRALNQPGVAAANNDNTKSPQPVSIPTYPETNEANASSRPSVQPVFAAANHDSENPPQDGSARCITSNQPLGATVETVTTNGKSNNRSTEHVPTERVTIDLTDDSDPPSSSTSRDTPVLQENRSSVQGGYQPCNPPPGQYPPAQYPAGHLVSGYYPSGPSAQTQISHSQLPAHQDSQGRDLEAMQIQAKFLARMAEKPLDWLQGENPFEPFKRGTKAEQRVGPANSRRPSQSNAEEYVLLAQSPEAGSVAPLPKTTTGRKTKNKVPKKTKVVLDAEAKKERAKIYRKTAAEKKKREKETEKQLLQEDNISNNAMRAQKQDRRAAKGEKRQDQARKPSEEVRPAEPQKTLDGRLYQKYTGGQQAVHGGGVEQAASEDHDSLFGDSEVGGAISPDADIVMHDDDAAAKNQDMEAVDALYAAECEAEFEADVDAGRMAGYEQGASGGQTCDPTTLPNDDDGWDDFPSDDDGRRNMPSESEESEEE